MTWVVGGRHVFCARCLADVQVTVTWDDKTKPKRYVDAVKKIYFLNGNLIVAFSGTIRAAFEVLEVLKKNWLPRLEERFFTEPDEVARQMARHVKSAFGKAKRRDSDVVNFLVFVLGTQSPYQPVGVYKMASPSFNIEEPRDPFELLEIGSGAGEPKYRDFVKRHSVPGYEQPDPDGGKPMLIIPVGAVALKYLHAEAAEIQTFGVSQAMHLMLTYYGGTTLHERPATPDRKFPQVAESWDELVRMMKNEHDIELEASDITATA